MGAAADMPQAATSSAAGMHRPATTAAAHTTPRPAGIGATAVPATPMATPRAFTEPPASTDMDTAGIYAMLSFPSFLTGFCGSVFARSKDQELGLACLRAWNDWMFEEYVGKEA